MNRLLFGLAVLCAPLATHAQTYIQNESTVEYSLRTYVAKLGDNQYEYTALMRNEQGYNATQVYGINNVYFNGVPCCNADAYITSFSAGNVGNVGTALVTPAEPRVNMLYSNDAMLYNPGPFRGIALYPGFAYTGTDTHSFSAGYGLLGCTAPLTFGRGVNAYAGSTCRDAGFDGWFAFQVGIYVAPGSSFAFNNIVTDVLGHYDESIPAYGTFNVVPEPATWALIGLGLLAVGMVRRKRV